MVPMLLVIAGWVVFCLGVYLPDSTVVRVLSYIPIFTSTLMLARLALGMVAWWEIVVTAALMLGTIALGAWFAARLYRYSVPMHGQKPGLGQALRLVRTRP
jgi:ABC-2 type transport system permease protein